MRTTCKAFPALPCQASPLGRVAGKGSQFRESIHTTYATKYPIMKKPNLPESFFSSSFRALPWLACGPSLILCHGWQEREEKAPGAQVYGISQESPEIALSNGTQHLREWPAFAQRQAEDGSVEWINANEKENEYADTEERNPLVVWEHKGERVA